MSLAQVECCALVVMSLILFKDFYIVGLLVPKRNNCNKPLHAQQRYSISWSQMEPFNRPGGYCIILRACRSQNSHKLSTISITILVHHLWRWERVSPLTIIIWCETSGPSDSHWYIAVGFEILLRQPVVSVC